MARDPDGTVPSCLAPLADVDAGLPRANAPLVAVSVPSGFVVQPRAASKSSSNEPHRQWTYDVPSTAYGHHARSARYRTAALFRPVSDAIRLSSM